MQCRACRTFYCNKAKDMSYINPKDGKTLYEYFNACTQLQAANDDDLPKFLCIKCIQSLQQAYSFRKEAHASDKELKRILLESTKDELKRILLESPKDELPVLTFDSTEQLIGYTNTLEVISPDKLSPDTRVCKIEGPTFSSDQKLLPKQCILAVPTKTEETTLVNEQYEVLENLDPLSIIGPTEKHDAFFLSDHQISITKDQIKTESFVDNLEETIETQFENDLNTEEPAYKIKYQNCGIKNLSKIHKCDHCDYKCGAKYVLKKHIFEYHAEEIVCRQCSKVLDGPTEMNVHKRLVHNTEEDICCPWCKQLKALPPKDLSKHIQTKHKWNYARYYPRVRMVGRGVDDPLQCELCKQFFGSASELVAHTQDHTFKCTICEMTFRKSPTYRVHLRRKHDLKPSILKPLLNEVSIEMAEKCELCSEYFSTKRRLRSHMKRVHNQTQRDYCRSGQEEKHICAYCPREFKCQKAVRLHERNVHLSDESIKKECPICHKKLKPKYLRYHMAAVHTAERKYVCDVCGDRFKNKHLLYGHKQLHFDRKFPCTICTKKFIYATDLKVHMRFHTGEEPYACHLCDRRFKMKGRLTYHLEKHNNVMHKCKVCSKEYASAHSLRNHSYVHTGGKPYRCTDCDNEFVKRQYFTTHLLRRHGKVMTDLELSEMFKANTGRYSRVVIFKETDGSKVQ